MILLLIYIHLFLLALNGLIFMGFRNETRKRRRLFDLMLIRGGQMTARHGRRQYLVPGGKSDKGKE